MKKQIPNFFTSMNLFSGCIASVMALRGEYLWVVGFILLGATFDFFDGFLARKLKVASPIGKELDSLADMVTFGVAPSLIVFYYLSGVTVQSELFGVMHTTLPFFAFLLAIFSGIRLAKFNVDERQTSSFIGLNTPSNAIFWIGLCYGLNQYEVSNDWVTTAVLCLVMLFSYLMVCELPMFSFKIEGMQLKGNEARLALIVFSILALIALQLAGLSVAILFYILLSVITKPKNS